MKDVNKWTRKEFEALPHRKWDENIGEIDSIIVMPLRSLHDSGFRKMDFIATQKGIPTYRLSGCSDVIHIEGIGGYGKDWLKIYGTVPDKIKPGNWSVDCLATSGLLRFFGPKINVGNSLSSFEIYST